ncbi:hypothetical protein HNP37_002616 [Flavobacterium nitrogenifigens]|uniref:Uncharacterized protein n=2 Tax=Flavobacterium TaxID=237 RepID=A0A7W7IXQ0_9FLAO|nr:hypothetical protein [Flavobacterium nitrogenifigens]MBB6387499.1 hypothetical protein [Flavobacterium notoginsengisoli]
MGKNQGYGAAITECSNSAPGHIAKVSKKLQCGVER